MKRRGFFGAVLGLLASPIAAKLPALPVPETTGMSLLFKWRAERDASYFKFDQWPAGVVANMRKPQLEFNRIRSDLLKGMKS